MVAATSNAAGQFAEADRLICQLLPAAIKRGLIGSSATASWSSIENDPDLGAIAAHVIGLVGRGDALVLLGRGLQQM